MDNSTKHVSILTHREFEILKLLAQGNKDREIATLLYISPLTVKTHHKNILKKLHVKNCAEAIYKATKLNLI
jgi:DNA-binding NarL/FixJ family response regulator